MNNLFHKQIGDVLKNQSSSAVEVILDEACGGEQRISLFIENKKRRESEICRVDAMITKSEKNKIIIEIEESRNEPIKICGKYLAANLASFYIHDDRVITLYNEKTHEPSVIFLQIVDIKGVSKQKKAQLKNIERLIKLLIKSTGEAEHGCIKEYQILLLDGEKDIDEKVEGTIQSILRSSH
jgi:hypothetical protein